MDNLVNTFLLLQKLTYNVPLLVLHQREGKQDWQMNRHFASLNQSWLNIYTFEIFDIVLKVFYLYKHSCNIHMLSPHLPMSYVNIIQN